MTAEKAVDLNHVLGCLLEITAPTQDDLSCDGKSQQEIFLIIAEMSRGMQTFHIIQDALANVEPDDKTVLIQRIMSRDNLTAFEIFRKRRPRNWNGHGLTRIERRPGAWD